jgi:hypothetical protein
MKRLKKTTPLGPVQILSDRIVEIEHETMKLEGESNAIRHLLGLLLGKPKRAKRSPK